MTKTSYFPKLIFQDLKYETECRAGLKASLDAAQKLLDIWNGLDVGPCTDIWTLVTQTSKTYKDAFNANIAVPQDLGKYKLDRDKYLSVISVPIPNDLFVAGRDVTKNPFYGYGRDLWSIQDGKVIQDEAGADLIIHSRNIYAHNERAEVLGNKIIRWINDGNDIDADFKIISWQRGFPVMPWSQIGKSFPQLSQLSLEHEMLRIILENLRDSE